MNKKSLFDIRKMFLDFFQMKKHKLFQSSSLIPNNDNTLLFTNAGMNQFKNIFLGKKKSLYKKIVTAQRCIRAGGKHNDFKNVGYTKYHHTYFEMLGNFSFGDYFKEDAIYLAWELLTDNKWFNISKKKLFVTVNYNDNDSYNIWKSIGLKDEKIIRIGDNNKVFYKSDNFWQMGNTGPCGPCTEIFYNYDEDVNSSICFKNKSKKYLEIWNIVFIQFNKQQNGSIIPLNIKSVDTGMGLERITSILQNVKSNYEIDIFYNLMKKISENIGIEFDQENCSLKIIADHLRAAIFLISDGVLPSNIKQGYVLRKIIRRALKHGYLLGIKHTFFYKLVSILINVMEGYSENVNEKKVFIEKILLEEENQFIYTLKKGTLILEKELKKLKNNTLEGNKIFFLYDTFGIPINLIEIICKNKKIIVDKKDFKNLMIQQKLRSKNQTFNFNFNYFPNLKTVTHIVDLYCLNINAKIKNIFLENQSLETECIKTFQKGIIILETTNFYPESGGQIGDKGILKYKKNIFEINNTKKFGKAILHYGQVKKGEFKKNQLVIAKVDKNIRIKISRNHSSTHLLNTSLEKVLGIEIIQNGSFISDKYFRFDFYYSKKIKNIEIKKIESTVNFQIRRNLKVKKIITSFDNAKKNKIKYLKNIKYEKNVSVIKIGDYSSELCGGTHIKRTGSIGIFKIFNTYNISNKIKRIECITGQHALQYIQSQDYKMKKIFSLLNVSNINIYEKIVNLLESQKKYKLELNNIKNKYIIEKIEYLKKNIFKLDKINILIETINEFDQKMIRKIIITINKNLIPSILILASIFNKKVFFVISVSKNLNHTFNANDLIKSLTKKMEGKGGGNSILAQGFSTKIFLLKQSLNDIKSLIIKKYKKLYKIEKNSLI